MTWGSSRALALIAITGVISFPLAYGLKCFSCYNCTNTDCVKDADGSECTGNYQCLQEYDACYSIDLGQNKQQRHCTRRSDEKVKDGCYVDANGKNKCICNADFC